jgi:hypothetical protein
LGFLCHRCQNHWTVICFWNCLTITLSSFLHSQLPVDHSLETVYVFLKIFFLFKPTFPSQLVWRKNSLRVFWSLWSPRKGIDSKDFWVRLWSHVATTYGACSFSFLISFSYRVFRFWRHSLAQHN